MAQHGELIKGEEHFATRRSANSASTAQHEAGPGYPASRLRHVNLSGRGNAGTRAQLLLQLQRTHGNRAVQRSGDGEGGYSPTLPPFLMGPATMGFDYLLHRLGPSSLPPFNPGQPSVAEMVQQHIARVQGQKAFLEGQQAKKHDEEIDDAQRGLTGLPPDWFTRGQDPPGTLETPQYDDVSPALNPWELQQAEEQRAFEEQAR